MSDLPSAYVHCGELLRAADPDRFLASLFIDAAHRPAVHALYAFQHEIARIRDVASNPAAGEIRLQWWRDAIAGQARGEASAHPVAAALLDAMSRYSLPPQALSDTIEARLFDLYDDPMPDMASLEGYAGETASIPMRLSMLILADGRDPGGSDAAGHAGVAYAITGLMRALPWHAARGQVFLPADLLARCGVTREDIVTGRGGPGLVHALAELRAVVRRHLAALDRHLRDLPPSLRMACLSAALCEGYLSEMKRPGFDPLRSLAERPQWRRQWTLWRTARAWSR